MNPIQGPERVTMERQPWRLSMHLRVILLTLCLSAPLLAAAPTVRDQDGRTRDFFAELCPKASALAINFIYTRCEGVCPTLGRRFVELRRSWPKSAAPLKLISITLDPEHDKPHDLARWLKAQGADSGGDWTFVTGKRADLDSIAGTLLGTPLLPTDMHSPVLVVRKPGGSWQRLSGLASTREIRETLQDP